MRREHQAKAEMLADYMIRRGIRHLVSRHAGGRHAFVVDFDTGQGTGHRLPPSAAAEIVNEANKIALAGRKR